MNKISLQLADDIREARDLGQTKFAEAALEKDVHISTVLNLVTQLNQENYSLIFCGGTSLVKAHRIIERMSEDVDFKVVLAEGLSTSAKRKLLSRIKQDFAELVDASGFARSDYQVQNNNSYFSLNIGYESVFEIVPSLRPEIKVEFTTAIPALPSRLLTTTTLIGNLVPQHQHAVDLMCLSLEETVSEKVVSFLRRSLPAFRESTGQYEGQLVRHIYDVHMLAHSGIDLASSREAVSFACEADALRYANTSPTFAAQPREELLSALACLDTVEISGNYDLFVADLLSADGPPFDEAMTSFITVAHTLLD